MDNPNGKQFEEWFNKLKRFFKNLSNTIKQSFQHIFTKENAEKTKQKALFWEQRTHKRIDNTKGSILALKRRIASQTKLKQISKKGAFGFNVFFGVIRNLFIGFILLLVLFGIFGIGTGLGYFADLVSRETPPSQESMAEAIGNVELVSTMYYANEEPISAIRTDLVRTTISSESISPLIKEGLIATEDENFYEHKGIVPKAIMRALVTELTGIGSQSGGSTLTQQLVKQQILTNEVTFTRKANEILLALRLENFFTKEEILTAYLNVSPFGRNSSGSNIAGIEEAAMGIFGVHASDVSLSQAAFLVGIPQNPYTYTPFTQFGERKEDITAALNRKNTVLYRMLSEGFITQQEYDDAVAYDIAQDFIPTHATTQDRNSYLYQAIEREAILLLMEVAAIKNDLTMENLDADAALYNQYYAEADNELRLSGYNVYSTVDKDIYNGMQDVATTYGDALGETFVDTYVDENGVTQEVTELAQTGSVLIENSTGKIMGFIGGRDFSVNQVDHAFSTNRSPGSTIKPLVVYGPAIEQNLLYPASMVPDTKIKILQPDGTYWEPTNFGDTISNTFMTARQALYQSKNNPTIKIYAQMNELGMNPGQYLKKMGIDSIDESEYGNPSLAIGATNDGPTVLEQTSAFTTFATGGDHISPYLIESITDKYGDVVYQHEGESTEVFSSQTAYLTLDMMRDVVSEGTARLINNQLDFSADWAGKTGTSEANRDIWFIASTPTITLSSWIGYDNYMGEHVFYDPYNEGLPTMRNLTYWSQLANTIYYINPDLVGASLRHEQPDGVVEKSVIAETGTLAGTITLPSGQRVSISGTQRTDLFKADALPFNLSYDFSPGATASDLTTFWGKYIRQVDSVKKNTSGSTNDADGAENTDDTETTQEVTEEANVEVTEDATEEIPQEANDETTPEVPDEVPTE